MTNDEMYHYAQEEQNDQPLSIERSILTAQPSKESIARISLALTSMVEEGTIDPIKLMIKMNYLQQIIDATKEQIREYAVIEMQKHSGKAEILNAEVKTKEAGVRYIYDNCKDLTRSHLKDIVDEYSSLLKERESFLKTLKVPLTEILDDGTMNTINPPQKISTTTIEIKFK